jgi:GDP/UDP-N,N'-diacetylbacillosamine 2-epimerase (hydrolysing)
MKVALITSSRADYGLLKPVIKRLSDDGFFDLKIIVTGTHLSEEFGYTYREIIDDGYHIDAKLKILEDDDSPLSITKNCANSFLKFGELYDNLKPDVIFVLGDRYEILCVVFAALFFKIPVIHYSGGEKTEGAYDDVIRHSITKMSHLHFVSCEQYRKRVIQLGEDPRTVFNVGSLGIDNIKNIQLLNKTELEKSIGFSFDNPVFLVSYHPETLSTMSVQQQFKELLKALDKFKNYHIIFTKSNADSGGRIISEMIDNYVKQNTNCKAFESLGLLRYLSTINYSEVVIGNSSSGITEVPSFNKPTVNIGDRQKGRVQAESIINSGTDAHSIIQSIQLALSGNFKASLTERESPFGNGTASKQIIDIMKTYNFAGSIPKVFYDINFDSYDKGAQ